LNSPNPSTSSPLAQGKAKIVTKENGKMSLILHRREVKMLTDAGAGFGCAEGVVDIEVGA